MRFQPVTPTSALPFRLSLKLKPDGWCEMQANGVLEPLQKLSRKTLLASAVVFSMYAVSPMKAQSCGSTGLAVQVLGSGGPELQDKRASTSYLIWDNGRARVIVDAGGGSALRFGESGAQMSQLDVVLFSHFHIDHSGDFPTLVFSSWFEDRKRPLPVFGPTGNEFMPSTTEFVRDLFSEQLVCSAATDPRGTKTSYISLTSIPIQSGDKPLGTPKKTTTERS